MIMNSAENAFLPWTGAPVRKIDNLCPYLSRNFPVTLSELLPRDISLFVDHGVGEDAVETFLEGASDYLKGELQRRLARADFFVRLGLISTSEIHTFMTARTDSQAWALYYSMTGGLGISSQDAAEPSSAQSGIIPCSSMRNHGVAWHRKAPQRWDVWLATSRKPNSEWNWDSDIGHESAHAGFAQVPLFLQALSRDIDNSHLASVRDTSELNPGHLARMMYFYSELAVVALRGEQRATPTGLPVADQGELVALLHLSEQLAPGAGFARSLDAFLRTSGYIDVSRGDEIYEIVFPIVRAIPRLSHFTNMGEPPDLDKFRNAIRRPCVVAVLS
jgi:hypothetical protein